MTGYRRYWNFHSSGVVKCEDHRRYRCKFNFAAAKRIVVKLLQFPDLKNEERDLFTTKGNMSYVWSFVWTCETDLPRLVSRVVNIWLYRNNKLELEIKLSLPFPNLYRYLLTPYYTRKAPMIGQSYQRKINWTEFISLPQLFHVICSWLPKRSWRNPRMISFRRKAKTNGYLETMHSKMKVIIKLNAVAEGVSLRMMQQQERGRGKEVMVYTVVHHCQHQQQKQITIEISRIVSLGAWLNCGNLIPSLSQL